MSTDQPPFDEATTAGHLSMDEIADLDAGLLTDQQASAGRAHVASCLECTDRATALTATGAALSDLGPVEIPSDVAQRIDAAIAAEAASTGTADAGTASTVTIMPDPSAIPRQRFRLPTAPASAAAVVIILAVVAIIVGHSHHHNSGPGVAAQGGSGAQSPLVGSPANGTDTVAQVSTGRTYDPTNLSSLVPTLVNLSAQPAGGLPTTTSSLSPNNLDQTSGSNAPGGGTETFGGTGVGSAGSSRSGTTNKRHSPSKNKKKSNGGNVTAPQAAPERAASTLTTNARVPKELAHLYSDRPALLQCGATASDTVGAVPLAVDFGRWSNPTAQPSVSVPAIIFVFAALDDPGSVDVYVVAPSCDTVLNVTLGIPK